MLVDRKYTVYRLYYIKKRKQYFQNFHRKLRTLTNMDSKEYWSLLNKSTQHSSNTEVNVPLSAFYDHFKKLGESMTDISDDTFDTSLFDTESNNDYLNCTFTVDELSNVIKTLTNNKACGVDFIRNEMLKNCNDDLLKILCRLFNVVLESGVVPTDWCIGLIVPLYKGKCDANLCDNYRGITLLSCIGKLGTACLNCRITNYLDRTDALGDEQAVFRSGLSTIDHAFTLNSIIDIYLQRKKRVFCAFIDYTKAFDLVDRSSLWNKLLANGINGTIITIIYNLYLGAKSCVKYNGRVSEYFTCNVGVRQGENLSPLLFALYLNDFEYAISRKYSGLNTLANDKIAIER